MIELEQPQKITSSFSIKNIVQNDMANGQEQYLDISGYASRAFDDKGFVVDSDMEHVNHWGFDLRRLSQGVMPLLYNHDQSKCVGKITSATYDKEGLLITARVYKLPGDPLTSYVYEGVKAGMFSAFSVGMVVKSFDIIEQDGEEYLQIAKSELLEVSVVSTPANYQSTFRMTNLKSVDGTNKNMLLLAKSDLKLENEEACDGFSCALKKHKLEMEQKDVTMDIEVKEVEQEESKEVVLGVTPEAYAELDEIKNPPAEEPVPPVEDSIATEGTTVTSGEADMVIDTNDKPSDAPQEDLEATPEPIDIIKVGIDALGTIDVAQLSDEQLESLYEVLSDIVDKIESRVVDAIVQEMTTVVAPAA